MGQKREEEKGVLEHPLPRAEVKRGGGSAVACGGGAGAREKARAVVAGVVGFGGGAEVLL